MIRQMTMSQEGSVDHCSGQDVFESLDLVEVEQALGKEEQLYLKQRSSDDSFEKVCLGRQLTLTMVTNQWLNDTEHRSQSSLYLCIFRLNSLLLPYDTL